MEATKIKGWVARDESGTLNLYMKKPELIFSDALSKYYWRPVLERVPLKISLYPELKWKDKPIEVELTINPV